MGAADHSWHSRGRVKQRRIFIFGAQGFFKLGALLEGWRQLMSYKLALHVVVTFTEQVAPIQKHITSSWIHFDIWNTNSHTETNEKGSGWVIWPHSHYIFTEYPTTSVAISDVSTSDLMFWEIFLMSDVLVRNLMLTKPLLLFSTLPLLLGWKEVEFIILSFFRQSLIIRCVWLSFKTEAPLTTLGLTLYVTRD